MKQDPCQRLFDEWGKAADEAQRLKNEYDSGSAYKKFGEGYMEREKYARYEIAKIHADKLHAALGKCYEKNGMIEKSER